MALIACALWDEGERQMAFLGALAFHYYSLTLSSAEKIKEDRQLWV